MSWKAIAYYTDDRYKKLSGRLVSSGKDAGVEVFVCCAENRGSWIKNTAMKPEFIYSAMDLYQTDIVYLDTDAVIRSYPKLFDDMVGFDIAAHKIDMRRWFHPAVYPEFEYLAGTIYLKNNKKVLNFVNKWVREQKKHPELPDQEIFNDVLSGSDLRIKDLPPTYCQIYDIMVEAGEAVIEHFQASRAVKDKHNGTE